LTTDISSKDELFSGFFDIHHLESLTTDEPCGRMDDLHG
jgi:hypothetical protein